MKKETVSGLLIWAVLVQIGIAHAAEATVRPGVYGTEGGWGLITLHDSRFKIRAVGVNGHTCGLTGSLVGHQGHDGACSIEIMPHGSALTITSINYACRLSCGARAGFDGEYLRLPPACTPTAQQTIDQRFLVAYNAKDYRRAYALLNQANAACGRYGNWLLNDRRRNDLAITAYHLGRKDECRRLSAQVADTEQLAQFKQTAPTDYDNLLPHYEAALHNAALCKE